jgi:hypothetical protein
MRNISQLTSLGLDIKPDGERCLEHLQYSDTAKALVVTTSTKRSGGPPRRVFVREIQEQRYREIGLPEQNKYFAEIAIAGGSPVAFARCCDEQDANYCTIWSIHLPDGQLSELPLPPKSTDPSILRVDISRLLGSSFDGSYLYVVVAYTPVFASDASVPVYWEYKVAKMSCASGDLDIITILPTPFA